MASSYLQWVTHLWRDLKMAVHQRSASNQEEWQRIPKSRCEKHVALFPRRLLAVIAQQASTQHWAKGLNTCDISFSFLIHLQKFLHFCIFLSRWGAEWTLMRNKMNFLDFSKWPQWNKEFLNNKQAVNKRSHIVTVHTHSIELELNLHEYIHTDFFYIYSLN